MPECFNLRGPESERLLAGDEPPREQVVLHCPISLEHNGGRREVGELMLQLKHNKRDQWIIKDWMGNRVVHESLLAEFDRRGFTGYRLLPSTVRFRDGSVSSEYRELVVVGWGGHARPESGIRLREECPGCLRREYSDLDDGEQLIDWSQWTGEDFFLVWPLPGFPLITKRVADALISLNVKSYSLRPLVALEGRNLMGGACTGYSVGRLSLYIPEDLAIKYGRPLGLE